MIPGRQIRVILILIIISMHKPIIFGKFSKAEVGESAYMRVHISCKKHTSETIIEYIYFMLKNKYKVMYWY